MNDFLEFLKTGLLKEERQRDLIDKANRLQQQQSDLARQNAIQDSLNKMNQNRFDINLNEQEPQTIQDDRFQNLRQMMGLKNG